MSTLIYASSGDQCIGKCDANCYNATHPSCDCICRGVNHGVGPKRAQENTALYAKEWIKKYSEENRIPEKAIQVNQEVFQLKFFS